MRRLRRVAVQPLESSQASDTQKHSFWVTKSHGDALRWVRCRWSHGLLLRCWSDGGERARNEASPASEVPGGHKHSISRKPYSEARWRRPQRRSKTTGKACHHWRPILSQKWCRSKCQFSNVEIPPPYPTARLDNIPGKFRFWSLSAIASENIFEKLIYCRAGESSMVNSTSGSKRFFKRSQQAYSSSTSRSSRQRRSREDEYAIYNIDNVDVENIPKKSCCQKIRSFFNTYASVFQMVLVLSILCLPGNIVTVVLQLQSPKVNIFDLKTPKMRPSYAFFYWVEHDKNTE